MKGGNLLKTSLQISFVSGPVLSKNHSFLITGTRIEVGGVGGGVCGGGKQID